MTWSGWVGFGLEFPGVAAAAVRGRREAVPFDVGAPLVRVAAIAFVDAAGRHDLPRPVPAVVFAHDLCVRLPKAARDPAPPGRPNAPGSACRRRFAERPQGYAAVRSGRSGRQTGHGAAPQRSQQGLPARPADDPGPTGRTCGERWWAPDPRTGAVGLHPESLVDRVQAVAGVPGHGVGPSRGCVPRRRRLGSAATTRGWRHHRASRWCRRGQREITAGSTFWGRTTRRRGRRRSRHPPL